MNTIRDTEINFICLFDFQAKMEDHSHNNSSNHTSHEEKFRVYNDALIHASRCQETKCEAHNGRCHKVKASIDHFVRCYGPRRKISPIESCKMCSKIWGLLCFHAKTCQTPLGRRCAVSQCDYLRDKITRKCQNDGRELQEAKVKVQNKLEEWSVERRIAQVEIDRQQVLQLIADIRARKAQVVQTTQQQQTMISMS
ncbi:unnamed protein product [Peronospora belbahrii]|uniref:histone acetyltransferase n=1 Tax=Peronospora belbahrii TaxID=622444 RepID=A0AAU9KVG1_9STRA|nr:unnamed protein product [Peronospora belbahrii]CAH0513760.1 unnamed protein product [Peronospora belbahrii]